MLAIAEAGAARPAVWELEPAVLVVGAAGNRVDVDLVEVVLARVLDHDAALERVAAACTQVVVFDTVWIGPREDAGYGPPSKPVKPAIDDRRDLVLDLLAVREDVRDS